MLTADLEIARAYIAHNPPPGTLLLCGVTGAHLYGFPSPDSDLDLKGIHLVPTVQLLGLEPATPPHDHTEIFQGIECDLTTNEASDALRLLLSGNGNMLERILSPTQPTSPPILKSFEPWLSELFLADTPDTTADSPEVCDVNLRSNQR